LRRFGAEQRWKFISTLAFAAIGRLDVFLAEWKLISNILVDSDVADADGGRDLAVAAFISCARPSCGSRPRSCRHAALEAAIDAKIEEQHKFVAWWKGNVAYGGGSKNRDRGSYSLADAEELTGMAQQRVSDLGKRLEAAIDAKIEEQHKFVGWWKRNVRGKGEKANSRDRGHFVSDVENLTGMTHQRVSDLGKRATPI
jgi:hypothetical protein